MFVIGLTGGIASGKSTVSVMLAEEGATVIDADKLGHELLRSNAEVKHEIVQAFGAAVLDSTGEINRRKLGEIVFNDPAALQRLNAITHPRIRRLVEDQLEKLRQEGVEVAVVEAALLIEAGWQPAFDQLWVTYVPPEVAVNRLINRNGMTKKEAQIRVSCQMSPEEKAKLADVVIDTNRSLEEVRQQVKEQWARLRAAIRKG